MVGSGQVKSDNGNSDTRANSDHVQMNWPPRAELGNINKISLYFALLTFLSIHMNFQHHALKTQNRD